MLIKIENLRLRTFIGFQKWEKNKKQDVVINLSILFDGRHAGESDNIEDSVDYKTITKGIIELVEQQSFNLLEKLVTDIGNFVKKDPRIQEVTVTVDKPGALRYTDSVSITETF